MLCPEPRLQVRNTVALASFRSRALRETPMAFSPRRCAPACAHTRTHAHLPHGFREPRALNWLGTEDSNPGGLPGIEGVNPIHHSFSYLIIRLETNQRIKRKSMQTARRGIIPVCCWISKQQRRNSRKTHSPNPRLLPRPRKLTAQLVLTIAGTKGAFINNLSGQVSGPFQASVPELTSATRPRPHQSAGGWGGG